MQAKQNAAGMQEIRKEAMQVARGEAMQAKRSGDKGIEAGYTRLAQFFGVTNQAVRFWHQKFPEWLNPVENTTDRDLEVMKIIRASGRNARENLAKSGIKTLAEMLKPEKVITPPPAKTDARTKDEPRTKDTAPRTRTDRKHLDPNREIKPRDRHFAAECRRIAGVLNTGENVVRGAIKRYPQFLPQGAHHYNAGEVEIIRIIATNASKLHTCREITIKKINQHLNINQPTPKVPEYQPPVVSVNTTPGLALPLLVEEVSKPRVVKQRRTERLKPIVRDILGMQAENRPEARPETKALGAIAKVLREAFELSLEKFAKMIGIEGSTLSNYETGKNVMGVYVVEALSGVTNLKMSTIFALAECYVESNGRLTAQMQNVRNKITMLEGPLGWERFVRAYTQKNFKEMAKPIVGRFNGNGTNYQTSHRFGS